LAEFAKVDAAGLLTIVGGGFDHLQVSSPGLVITTVWREATMQTSRRLSLEIDQEAGAAYLQFSDELVDRSVEFSEDLTVDLDKLGVVVGIEILDLTVSVPLDTLAERFHIRTETLATLLQSLRSSTTSRHVGARAPAVSAGSLTPQRVNNLTLT